MALKSFAGGLVFGERHGTGPPRVVALHGWGRDRHDFAAILEGLDALALDLPGFGSSPPPPVGMGAEGYAKTVAPILDELGTPQVLVGHSLGGRLATVLTAARPELVSGLALVGVPLLHPEGGPDRESSLAIWLTDPLASRFASFRVFREQRRARRWTADYGPTGGGRMYQVLRKFLGETYEDYLRQVTCPVRMVWGEDDEVVPPEVARQAARLVKKENPDCRLDVVPDCGHDILFDAPDRVRGAIEELL